MFCNKLEQIGRLLARMELLTLKFSSVRPSSVLASLIMAAT